MVEAQNADVAEGIHLLQGDIPFTSQQREQVRQGGLPPVHLTRLQGGRSSCGIWYDAPFDSLEIGVLTPCNPVSRFLARLIIGIPRPNRECAGIPLVPLEAERPTADHLVGLDLRIWI